MNKKKQNFEKRNQRPDRQTRCKRKKKRKIFMRRIFIVSAVSALIFTGVWGISKALGSVFAVKNIYAPDSQKYNSKEITEACGIKTGQNLCFVNTAKYEKQICKNLPYISSAKIKKKFPDKIEINVNFAEPYLSLFAGGQYFLIDKNNKVLEVRGEPFVETLSVIGLDFSVSDDITVTYGDLRAKEYVGLIEEKFKESNIGAVKEIDVSDVQNAVINYDDRIKIYLGDCEDTEYKIITAAEIITSKIGVCEKGSLNLKNLKNDNKSYFIPQEV